MKNNYYNEEDIIRGINSLPQKQKLVKTNFGFYRVDPLPNQQELNEYYQKVYFNVSAEQIQSKGMDSGIGSPKERYHFARQYREVLSFVQKHFKRQDINVLDVGCGCGNYLRSFKNEGYCNLYGTEIDPKLASVEGIKIINAEFLEADFDKKFDFIMFNNVLEHVREPEKFIEKAVKTLASNGVIRVQVPNDLCYSQYSAIKAAGKKHYYFFNPFEHLNYFNFSSMRSFLDLMDLEILEQTTSFPMDMFLLFGMGDYTDKAFGKQCHLNRSEFEFNTGDEFLADFYLKLSEIGFGRTVVQYARKKI